MCINVSMVGLSPGPDLTAKDECSIRRLGTRHRCGRTRATSESSLTPFSGPCEGRSRSRDDAEQPALSDHGVRIVSDRSSLPTSALGPKAVVKYCLFPRPLCHQNETSPQSAFASAGLKFGARIVAKLNSHFLKDPRRAAPQASAVGFRKSSSKRSQFLTVFSPSGFATVIKPSEEPSNESACSVRREMLTPVKSMIWTNNGTARRWKANDQ